MGDLKPLGSEKLNGDEKLKRILQLTYYKQNPITENTGSKKAELIKESANGVYGIVREKDGYYVKKGLNENTLDYIGGLFMKNKNKFNSYAEALKRLQLLSGGELNEATKYVLKQNSGQANEAPVPAPDMGGDVPPAPDMGGDVPPAPAPDMDMGGDVPPAPEMGGDVPPSDETDMGDEGDMGGAKPSDYMSEIQKYSGKLGQELRDQKEKMESDDIKYVLNMIISAVDLDKLDDEDIEEIGKKFDREIEDDADMSDDMPDVPADDDTTPAEPTGDEGDLGEMDVMDKLETFINTPMSTEEEIDLSKYADLGNDDVKEIDLDEIKKEINKSISETLGKYFK